MVKAVSNSKRLIPCALRSWEIYCITRLRVSTEHITPILFNIVISSVEPPLDSTASARST